ncbi:MAG: MFS transporter, partial [Rubrobacter sp.]
MAEEQEGVFDRRHRALTVGAVLAVSIVAFEGLALPTVAPEIARDLDGVALYGWIFSAFLLAQIVGAVAAGQHADRVGVARPFIISLALFGSGLLVGSLAPSMMMLIAGRALQGLGGGALVTCVYALINTGYPDHLRNRMLAAFSSAYILPALVGPVAAGFIAEQLSWRAVFYGFLPFLVVVGILTAPSFGRLSPPNGEKAADEGPAHRRLSSAVALAAGTGLLLTGLSITAGENLQVFGLEVRSVIVGPLLTGFGVLVAVPALRAVLPDGTLVARRGLPATLAANGLLAAGYFYTETYMVLA